MKRLFSLVKLVVVALVLAYIGKALGLVQLDSILAIAVAFLVTAVTVGFAAIGILAIK